MQYRAQLTVSALLVLFTFVALASGAEAQRRRRRRAPAPQESVQEAPPEDSESGDGETGLAETSGSNEPGAAPAAPAAGEASTEPDVDGSSDVGDAGVGDEPLGPNLGPLRTEFTTLMDELVRMRSKIAVLGRQLFRTRVRVGVENQASDDHTLSRLVLTLDGAPIFRGDASRMGGDEERRAFEGFAAPGPHVLGVEAEQRSREDENYRYTLRDEYRIQVVRGRLTEIIIVLDDDSDIAEDFEEDGEGEYDVRVRVRVATRDLGAR